jgi:crotonobetainyl-CoA:carnitine CoA-transferase CaiB-like acyl-CoA transferase
VGEAEQAVIASVLVNLSSDQARALLENHDVWTEACISAEDVSPLCDPALRASGTVLVSQHPVHGELAQIGPLVRFSRAKAKGHAPIQGEHTCEILSELGFNSAAIDRLYAAGVVV